MNTLSEILDAACEILGVTTDEVVQRHRTSKCNTARGLYYAIAISQEYRPEEVGRFVSRSRVSCFLTARKYIDYINIGDRYIRRLYTEIINKLTN